MKTYTFEGVFEYWDNETFDGGRYFSLDRSPDYPELDVEIAEALGITDRNKVRLRVVVERLS